MPALSNPHDRYFRETFARPEIARDFLHNYLPPAIRARLDLSTLDLQKDSFVDPDLQQHFSDLLYQVRTVADQPGYIYLLFEHKSYPDPLTIFQMLRYCIRIWEKMVRDDDSLTQLPPIIPLLVYHGEETWTGPLDMVDLLAGNDALHIYGPRFSCSLTDLSPWSEEEIKGEVTSQAVRLALRSVRDPRLGAEQLPRMLGWLMQLTNEQRALEYVQALLVYLGTASSHLTDEEVRVALQETLADKGEELMPTLASKWYKEGRIEGRAEGREVGREEGREVGRAEGREEGREEGVMLTLTSLLEHRFGPAPTELVTQFQMLSLDELQTLSLFVLDAASIDQVTARVRQLRN